MGVHGRGANRTYGSSRRLIHTTATSGVVITGGVAITGSRELSGQLGGLLGVLIGTVVRVRVRVVGTKGVNTGGGIAFASVPCKGISRGV